MTDQSHPDRSSRPWATLAPGAVLALAGWWAYHNTLSAPFVFDDLPGIVANGSIRHLGDLGRVLSPPQADGSGVAGRPLVNLSLAVNYAIGGLEVRGYHLFNLMVHVLAGLTLFGIVRRTGAERGRRFGPELGSDQGTKAPRASAAERFVPVLIALLWTLHPLQTESVTCVIQRTELLMGLFYLLTLYCFIRACGARPLLWQILSVAACLCGMASKEVMVTAPVIVLLYDRTFVAGTFAAAWRTRRRYYLALFSTWLLLAFLVLEAGGQRGGAAGFGLGVTWWNYALTQAQAVAMYLKLAVWPHPLVLDYGQRVITEPSAVWGQLCGLALLLAATLYACFWSEAPAAEAFKAFVPGSDPNSGPKRWPRSATPCPLRPPSADGRALGFLGAWFFVILAPSSSVVPLVTQTMAEHRMYLPLAAIIAAAVFGLRRLLGEKSLGFVLLAAIGLGALTVARNRAYGSALALWQDTVARVPDNPRAFNDLGLEFAKLPGRSADAISSYETALRLAPHYAEAHNNLAISLDNAGQPELAIAQYEQALADRPRYPEALEGLAVAQSRAGRAAEAVRSFEAALRLRPEYAEAHYNFGAELEQLPGRQSEAIEQYRAALRDEPNYPEAHFNLGNVLAGTPGRMNEAIEEYQAAVGLRPNYPEAYNNLAFAYARSGRIDLAIPALERALQLDPNFAGARENLAKLRALAQRP